MNGPEVLSKFVGETEKNVRDLFADAEQDQRTRGMSTILIKYKFLAFKCSTVTSLYILFRGSK